ncbi:MAG: helix-turn-helix transcriptional regulator [Bacteroidales bacterium]|jgi:transcriptional regulator with XRE-family HTH domain|nr:helix-turn-helix transcriptional regulator [Bacteroidales bacterium]
MENEKIEQVIHKIVAIRNKNGYTLENMAHELDITPAAYRKIETGETKLTVERLFCISDILRTSMSDLLEIGNDVFQQTNHEHATGYQQKIENFYQENKDVYEKLIASKNEQITLLQSLLKKRNS